MQKYILEAMDHNDHVVARMECMGDWYDVGVVTKIFKETVEKRSGAVCVKTTLELNIEQKIAAMPRRIPSEI